MKILQQYLEYYAKYSLFNLKGSKSKVTEMEFKLKSATIISFVMLNEEKTSFCNNKCMKFTGQTSDSMTTKSLHSSAGQCLMFARSLAGTTMAQFRIFFSSDCL